MADIAHFEGQVTKFTVKGITTTRPGQVVWVQLWCIILELASLHGGASIWAYSNAVQYGGTDTGSERQLSVGKAHQSANRKDKLRLNGPYGVGRLDFDS